MKNYKTVYENIIINSIDLEGYNLSNDVSQHDKIKETYEIFKSEYDHEIIRQGSEKKAFKNWLQGLPSALTVPFYNYEILNIAYISDLIRADATKEQEDQFLNDYWLNLSNAFFTLKQNL